MAHSEEEQNKLNRDLLDKFNKWFQEALDDPAWRLFRSNAIRCFKFKEGDQWDPADRKIIEDRHQPVITNNQVRVTINRLMGDFVKIKTRTTFRGRNLGKDDKSADILDELFLYIRQNNELEFEEQDVAEDGFTCGFGVFDTFISFDEVGLPEVVVRRESVFNIFPDPKSKIYDWNKDAHHIFRAKWVDLDVAQAKYPKMKSKLAGFVSNAQDILLGEIDLFRNENFVNEERERVRLVEVQYKTREKETLLIFKDGSTLLESELDSVKLKEADDKKLIIDRIDKIVDKIKMAVFTGGLLLEHSTTKRKFFSFVPYFIHRKENGTPYSETLNALSLQEAINKRESKAMHLLNVNQAIYEQGAVEDKEDFGAEMQLPDGQMELARGFFDKFELVKNVELAKGQLEMHREAKSDFKSVVGVDPQVPNAGEIRSGVGVARQQAVRDILQLPAFANFERTRKILAHTVLDLVQIYHTQEKIFSITDDLGASREIELGMDNIKAIKQNKYDVVLVAGPDVNTSEDEQFQQLSQTLPQVLQYGGTPYGELLIELSNIRRKEEMLTKIRNMPPPPQQPKISVSAQLDQLMPMERAFFFEKMGSPEVAEAVRQANLPPTNVIKKEMQTEKTEAKLQGDREQLLAEIESNEGNQSFDLAGKQLELQKKELELEKAKVALKAPNKKEGK